MNKSVGLKRGTVQLQSYDADWPKLFTAEKAMLQKIFIDADIEHIGSTSVPGLSAKPIIDICVSILRLADHVRYIDQLQKVGYTFMPERVFADSVFLPKGPEDNRTHYLHIVEAGSAEHVRLVAFRDALRGDPKLVAAYDKLKVSLAEQYAADRNSYSQSKNDFIKRYSVKNKEINMTFEFAIVDCLVEKDGKFLIVQESKLGRAGLYNLPGGHVDGVETVAEAAVREVEEETGYRVELTGFIGLYQSIYPDKQLNVCGPVFLANVISGELRASKKHPEVRWVSAEELFELAAAGKFWTAYPPIMLRDYQKRGAYPLDAVSSMLY